MSKMNQNIDFKKINKKEIQKDPILKESDRGCVLILSTDLEDVLRLILEHWFKAFGEASNTLIKNIFDYTGSLGTFSSKINLCRALGFINQSLYHDLCILKSIRNIAAHDNKEFSLSDVKIIQELEKLSFYSETKKYTVEYYKDKKTTSTSKNKVNKEIFIGLIRRVELGLYTCEVNNLEIALIMKNLLKKNRKDLMKGLYKKIEEEKSV